MLIMTWIIWRSVLQHTAELGSALTATLDCCYQLLPLSARAITNTAMYFCILHYGHPATSSVAAALMCLYEFLVKISLAAGKWANSGGASHSDQAPKAAFHDTGRNRQVSGCLHGIYNSRASLGTPARPSSFQSLLTFSGSKLNVAVQLNSTNDICRVLRKTHCVYTLFTGFPRPHLLR